jgi:Ser/Thr protein kinase RdoA (MazF antagonist)
MPDTQVLPPREASLAAATTLARRWFPAGQATVAAMLGGGFSGSPLFRVEADGGTHVLKAFPPGTSAGRVCFVHTAVGHLRSCGVGEVPTVRLAADGESFVADASGQYWELQGFVAGESSLRPTAEQIAAAVRVVARIHQAAATLAENPPDRGPSPGIARRVEQAQGMLARPWAGVEPGREADATLATLIRPLLHRAADVLASCGGEPIVARVADLVPGVVPRQTVLRDVWAPHVIYESAGSARVVGIVDCHAMGLDTAATDLARLLGSWAVEARFEDAAGWDTVLDTYARVRPLADVERRLVPFLAASGVVFGLDNWFRWVFEQGRRFSDRAAVASRVERLTAALPAALRMLHTDLPRCWV